MSVSNNPTQASRLSEFLAEQSGARPSGAARAAGPAFAGALEQALLEAGFRPGEFRVSARPAPGPSGARGAEVMVTFLESTPAAAAEPVQDGGGGELPPYDPRLGPRISRDMWTEALLTEDLPAELLRNVQDPADLLRARIERLRQPTNAKVVSGYDGTETPINPSFLSTRAQAEAVREKLIALGLEAGEIQEVEVAGGPFATDWADEERRMYTINGLNVGLILERYAAFPKEYADRMIRDEIRLLTGTEA